MPTYITNALKRLQYIPHTRPQFSSHQHVAPKYGRKGQQQFTPPPDLTKPLSTKATTHAQSIIGTLLFYARALDCTLHPALNDISSHQAAPTVLIQQRLQRVLDYVATMPQPSIRYNASDMVLHVDCDATYLVAPKARSQVAG